MNRRQFLKLAGNVLGALALALFNKANAAVPEAHTVYMPLVAKVDNAKDVTVLDQGDSTEFPISFPIQFV